MKRPRRENGAMTTTPGAIAAIELLGGITSGRVSLTRDERDAVADLYGFTRESHPLLQTEADTSAMRHAREDGLRMVAWFARFIPPGEDPLKHLVQLTVERGWDIAPEDVAWADDTAEAEEEP